MSEFTLVDTRARAAGAALREAAARRPVTSRSQLAPSASSGGRPARSGALRPALIVAAVLIFVAALVAVATRDPQPAQPVGPKDLRYIVTGLDQFWTVDGARDGGGVESNELPGYFGTLYGTLGDPTKPGMVVSWVDANAANTKPFNDERFAVLIKTSNLEQFEVNGLPAACGDRQNGATQCRVETERGFVATFSLGLAHADLRKMLSTVRHDGTAVTIDPASVPTSLTRLSSGTLGSVYWGSDVFSPAASAVRWTNSDGSAVTVTVIHDDGKRLTRRAVEPGWETTRIGEVSGFHRSAGANLATLNWLRDGKVFTVEATLGSNQPGSAEDLAMQFATALRRASDTDWAALPPWRDDVIDPGTEVTATSTEASPSSVSVPGTGQETDVTVGLDRVAQFGGEFTVRSTGPGVANDDVATIGMALDSFRIRSDGGTNGRQVTSEPVLDVVPLDAFRGVYLLTSVDGELVVTGQNGTRYHATPEALFEGNDIRFAMVILPNNFVKAEFVAPDGTVLAEFDGFV